MRYVLANLPQKRTVLNVNFPKLSTGRIKGIQPAAVDTHKLGDVIFEANMPHHYRIGPMRVRDEAKEGTDRYALQNGYVSVTSLTMDQTDLKQLASYDMLDSDDPSL